MQDHEQEGNPAKAVKRCRFPLWVFVLAFLAVAPCAAGQEESVDGEEGEAESEAGREETSVAPDVIEVTAQKREQDVMNVPVTVGTVGSELIEESSSILMSEIDKFIPGFDFSDSSMTQAGVSMRGISSPSISVGGDPSSATFYDDIYMPRAAQNVLFSDIERIEVLKGPQGTLFGRNAAMGVVNIVPKRPGSRLEGFAKATLGTDRLRRYEGMANLPASDNLYFRANFLSNERDGIVENLSRPHWNRNHKVWDLGEENHQAGRIAMLWDISPATWLQVAFDIDDLEQAPPMAVGVSKFAYNGGEDPFAGRAENDVRKGVESRDMYGITAKLNHEFNSQWSAKYVMGFRDWETVNRQDEDGTADITRYFDTSNNEDSDILYNELQLNFENDRFNVVGGFSYSAEDVSQRTELNLTADTIARLTTQELNAMLQGAIALDHIWNPGEWAAALTAMGFSEAIMAAIGMPDAPLTADIVRATGDTTYDLVSEQLGIPEIYGPSYSGTFWQENVFNTGDFSNWGVYADADYAITDKWNVIVGVRYSRDEKDFTWFIPQTTFAEQRPGVSNALFPMVDLEASDSWDELTGRFVTSYQVAEDQMIFASYSTGYKSGGFDSLVPIDQAAGQSAFAPEDSANIELGYKATLWDRLIANVSAYRTELDNFQITVESKKPGSPQAIPSILNENRVIKGIELDLRWYATDELLLALVSDFRETDIDTPAFYNSIGELVPARSRSFDAETNYTLIANWSPTLDWNAGVLNIHLDYVFVENTNDQQPNLEPFKLALPRYFADRKDLNMRISLTDHESVWELGLWGKNLLDERYVKSVGGRTASVLGTPFARINRGREVGLDFKYSF